MSARNMSAALRTPGLMPSERLVFAYLADRSNGEMMCWPQIDAIAFELSLSRRSVISAIKVLSERGLIDVTHRYKRSSVYFLKPLAEPARYSGAANAPQSSGSGAVNAPQPHTASEKPQKSAPHGTSSGAAIAPEKVIHMAPVDKCSGVQKTTFSGAKNRTSGVQPLHSLVPLNESLNEPPSTRAYARATRTIGNFSGSVMPARNAACALFVEMRRRGENP